MWSGDEKVGHLKNSGGKGKDVTYAARLVFPPFLLSPRVTGNSGPWLSPGMSLAPRLCPVLAYLRGGTRVKAGPCNSDTSKDWGGRKKTQKLPLKVSGSSLNEGLSFLLEKRALPEARVPSGMTSAWRPEISAAARAPCGSLPSRPL